MNPMIAGHGPGPEGAKCGSCAHHYFKVFASKYPKCELRSPHLGKYNGASTDHSSRYAACSRYEEDPGKKIILLL